MGKMGRKIDMIRECFKYKMYDQCLKICRTYKNDPDLSIYFLRNICEMDDKNEPIMKE